jgi:hypothetical protein
MRRAGPTQPGSRVGLSPLPYTYVWEGLDWTS